MQPGSPSPRAVSTEDKVRFLASPAAHGGVRPDVVETHMSCVFLTDRHAYQLKKPVRHAFLDFTTLEDRRADCEEELRLNRRLARDVYLDVVPLACTRQGGLALGGSGEVVDWLVKMRRLQVVSRGADQPKKTLAIS